MPLPDLSDVQVIIKTSYPRPGPQIVENQVTYPLTTTMLSVPGAKTVRGFSQFGDSYVYVIFEDGTDLYWGPFPRAGVPEPGTGKTARRCEF
ncbi:cation efflux system protein SilA [Enterobacter cloacae]|uniref:Cation efflux system protein SilA n=1 Tax=Enterobacter cloacae TaxID=550 RepID=A0A377LSH9_ENTCL|nr:cation efflux system protein SilA [Enterobacter cloacae]